MVNSKKLLFLSLFFFVLAVVVVGSPVVLGLVTSASPSTRNTVLGETSETVSTKIQAHFGLLSATSTPVPPTPTLRPTPTIVPHSVTISYAPREVTEGNNGAFTWSVNGPQATIHTTTVYYGTTSFPGTLQTSISPADTKYTDSIKDFMQGDFVIPLQFVGNATFSTPGTYFFRVYARIGEKHIWSEEGKFVVVPIPKHEIKVINRPTGIQSGQSEAITWEVYGPTAKTGFTTIVGGKESKPGTLDHSIDIPKTPYKVMVPDFTSGTYDVPLRFIGNVSLSDPGVYYFRALAFINGKNIWSDEYSFTVE